MSTSNLTADQRVLLNTAYARGVALAAARGVDRSPFLPTDVTSSAELAQAARLYAMAYVGTFDYMRDMSVRAHHGLTAGQAKGVLNCLYAEGRRNVRQRAEQRAAEPAPTSAPSSAPATATAPVTRAPLNVRNVEDGRYRVRLADDTSLSVRILGGVWEDEPESRQLAILTGQDRWAGVGKARADGAVQLWRKAADAAPRVREALEILAHADDQLAWRLAYALVGTQCSYCGLNLDTEESITAGYGPTCAKKRGLPWGARAEIPASVQAARALARAIAGADATGDVLGVQDAEQPSSAPSSAPALESDQPTSTPRNRYRELFPCDACGGDAVIVTGRALPEECVACEGTGEYGGRRAAA